MKFRSMLLAATIAVGSLAAGTAAMAKQTVCWGGHAGQRLERVSCNVTKRVNANGHTVFDVAGLGTVVLWDDNTAELIGGNGRYTSRLVTRYEGNGVWRLVNVDTNFNFAFRY